MSEEKRQHLEFIQNVITRMNTNSFKIKELTVALITASLGVYAIEKASLMLLAPVMPTIALWFLDSYYLQQERKFRGIYNDVAGLNNLNEVKLYEMPIDKYTAETFRFKDVLFSKTLLYYYLSLIIVCFLFYSIVKLTSLVILISAIFNSSLFFTLL